MQEKEPYMLYVNREYMDSLIRALVVRLENHWILQNTVNPVLKATCIKQSPL